MAEFYQRIKYDRNTLLQYRNCPTARIRPFGLPDYPEIILDKILASHQAWSMNAPIQIENGEYSNKYVWKSLQGKNGTRKTMIKTSSNVPCSTHDGNKNETLTSVIVEDETSFTMNERRRIENEKDTPACVTTECNFENKMKAVIPSLETLGHRKSDQSLYVEGEEQNILNNCDNNKGITRSIKDEEIVENSKDVYLRDSAAKTYMPFGSECGIICDNCIEEMEKAIAFCVICNDFLCTVCCKVHQRSKLSKHHQLLHGEDMPTDKVDLTDDEICDIHTGELKHFYCTKHKDFYCPVCITLKHKHRCGIKHISEVAEGFAESEDYKALHGKLNEIANLFGSFGTLLKKRISSKDNISKEVTAQIYAYRSEVITILDNMIETALFKKDSVLESHFQFLAEARRKCTEYKKAVSEVLSRMKKLENYPQRNALVFEANRAENKVTEFEIVIGELQALNLSKKFKFTPNERLREVLDSISDYGTIDITNEDSHK